jgi:RimJ/RimL family protein N-acetyltransferase/gamma-glutamylcyclotransferase (GGCT)/AIG2-like uncharacterized protein YtfP
VDRVPYFAYGTTQEGFAHHRRLAGLLGEPVGRFRTVTPHAVVVPRRAACGNPGCPYVHRMAALVPARDPLRVDGDLFLIGDEAVGAIDELETGSAGRAGPYVREPVAVVSLDGNRSFTAMAYRAREPARWQALVELGQADALTTYPHHLAIGETLKDCCVRTPGHPPPHDVVDPLDGIAAVRIEPWGEGDLPLLEQLLGDPAMMEHLGGPESREQIAERHARYLAGADRDPIFKIVAGAAGEAAGWVGYWERDWRDERVYEIGWSVLPAFQGRGIATRATAQAIDVARSARKRRFLHAFPAVANAPSNGICRTLGFTLRGACELEYPPGTYMRCNDWRLDLSTALPPRTAPRSRT